MRLIQRTGSVKIVRLLYLCDSLDVHEVELTEDEKMFTCFTREIDDGIRHMITKINQLGFRTYASCSGLWKDHPDEIKEPWKRNVYVAFIADEKFTLDLLFRMAETIWGVEIGHSDIFGRSVTARLPCYYGGAYLTEIQSECAWDELIEVLEGE